MSAPIADQPHRDAAASELAVSAFIEAGAGTGKSTTLINRIIATITGEPAVPVTAIAAITFTEKAATELRSRLRSALEAANEQEPDPRVTEALATLDAASVGTIHSLTQRILRTHALSVGLPPGFTVASASQQVEARGQRTRAVVEHWDTHLPPSVLDVLAAYGRHPIELMGLVEALDAIWLRISPAAFTLEHDPDAHAMCHRAADELDDFLTDAVRACGNPDDLLILAFRDLLPPLIETLRSADPDAVGEQAKQLRQGLPAFKLGNRGSAANWTGGTPKEWRDRLKEMSPQVTAALLAPVEVAVREALRQAHSVLSRARADQARAGLVSFDDMLELTRDLLERDADVRAHVHAEFQVVLVDEFQDTDPIQWQIIRCITAHPDDPRHEPLPGRLIVVGDPKQAIYSFRGADIDTYTGVLDAFRATAGLGAVYALTTNFRSVEPVLHWVNAVFAGAMSGGFQVEYAPLDVQHRPPHPHPGPAVTVVRDPQRADGDPRVDSAALEPRLLAQEIRRAVADRWQITTPVDDTRVYTRACLYSDMAVLYPARTGLPALLEALDEAGVPYRSGDPGLVFTRPPVAGLIAALAVVDDPGRQLDLWTALKSPLLACDDADLVRHRRAGGSWWSTREPVSGRVAEALALLDEVRRQFPSPQPVEVIDALLQRTRLLEALAHAPRGAFESDCVRMLRAHAQQWQDDGGVGIADYLTAATEAQESGSRSSLPEPHDRTDNAVQLMTVHQAKGLEFPLVALSGMARQVNTQAPSFGVVDSQRYEFNLSKACQSVGFAEWNTDVRTARAAAERVRMLYVACTRARDHLIVSLCGEFGTRTDIRWGRPLWEALPLQSDHVTEVEPPTEVAAAPAGPPAPPLPDHWEATVAEVGLATRESFVASPSGAGAAALGLQPQATDPLDTVHVVEADEPLDVPDVQASTDHLSRASRDGRPLGRAVHAALDEVVRRGTEPSLVAAACSRAAEQEEIASETAEVSRRVAAALASGLMEEALAAPRRWSELYLAAPVEEGPVRVVDGFADLVFEHGEGLVLVDYKTDDSLSPPVLAHYREQLAGYAELLQRATGLPVTRRVVLHLTSAGATEID